MKENESEQNDEGLNPSSFCSLSFSFISRSFFFSRRSTLSSLVSPRLKSSSEPTSASLLLLSWLSYMSSPPCSDRDFSDSFFSCRAAATAPGLGLADRLPFELGSGVPELPMPLVILEPEVIGGIIPGIPMAYIAIRLGSLIILGSIPILASILGSMPAIILGSHPAIILGSIMA